MKRIIVMGTVLLVTSAAYFGCRTKTEEETAKHMERRAEWVTEKIADELDLTAEQQVLLKSIKAEVLTKRTDVRELHRGLMNDLFAAAEKESITEEDLNGMFAQREASLTELRKFAVAKYVQFHSSLTPEQRETLKANIGKYKERRG